MAMLERTSAQKMIISSILLVLMISVGLFLLIMFWQSNQFADGKGQLVTQTVAIGPVKLLSLQKTAIEPGGYQATIKFLPGLIIYFGVGVMLAGVLAGYRIRRMKK